jgi:PAS domain S-box-containing protein
MPDNPLFPQANPAAALGESAVASAKLLERFRGLFESSPDAVWIMEGHRFVECNPAAVALFGFGSQVDFLNVHPSKVSPEYQPDGEDSFGKAERMMKLAETQGLQRFEWVHRRFDGSTFFAEVTLSPITLNEHKALYAVVRDITDRKKSEAELDQYRHHLEALVEERTIALSLAKEAAEAASRAKSTFLANMSHELRTPINAIMGMTDIVLRRSTDLKQIDQLTKVKQASTHLLGIINDLLDMSRIEADKFKLIYSRFKIGEIPENLVSLLGHKAAEKGLALSIDVAHEVANLAVHGDPRCIGQILANLTANAIKFTAEGSITVRILPAEESEAEILLRFEVQDTGIGIKAEDSARIFNTFEQADGSMTRKYGGNGLGLAICRRLAQLMGGSIGVESEVGAGSTFWFTVRLDKIALALDSTPEQTTLSAREQLRDCYAGTRILLVEDAHFNQEMSRILLEGAELNVDLATDGVEAVEMARWTDYALILMDIQMPNLNGIDATRAIRALPGRERTPILSMTANDFDEDLDRYRDAGMDDHIGKPVNPDRLFDTLLKWLTHA